MHKIWTCSQISPLIYYNNGTISYSRSQHLFQLSFHTCYACGFPLSLIWLHQNKIIPTHTTNHTSSDNLVHILRLVRCCHSYGDYGINRLYDAIDERKQIGLQQQGDDADSDWQNQSGEDMSQLNYNQVILIYFRYCIKFHVFKTQFFFKTINLKFLMFVYFWVVGLYFKRDNSHCWDLRAWWW